MAADDTLCGNCSGILTPNPAGRLPSICPHCGQIVVINDDDADAEQDQSQQEQPSDELESLKIHQIVRVRRALIRTRTYYLAAGVTALAGAVQVLYMLWRDWRALGWSPRIQMYVGLIPILLIVAWTMYRRMQVFSELINKPLQEDPTTPPNFDHLSDGSQHLRNLDDLGRR